MTSGYSILINIIQIVPHYVYFKITLVRYYLVGAIF